MAGRAPFMSEARQLGEVRIEGIAAAPGIARGGVVVYRRDDEEHPNYSIADADIPAEVARLEGALIATRSEILEAQKRIADAIGAEDAAIFDAHLLVLEDQTLIDEVQRSLRIKKINVEEVFFRVARRYADTLRQIDDSYLRERAADIEDVTRRVLRHLTGRGQRRIPEMNYPHLIIAHDISPADAAGLDRAFVLGFATEAGSRTSHTAIMARTLGLPAAVGLRDMLDRVVTGDEALLDGYSGRLILRPSPETLAEYGQLLQRHVVVEEALGALRETESVTKDGRHIILSANIELPQDVEIAKSHGARGIGLYRTEFFFLERSEPPSEELQVETYLGVAKQILPESLIIRTLDLGGDKLNQRYHSVPEPNPFLGWRAIRFCLQRPDLFRTQLRAILRASTLGNVSLMYPLVSGVEELRRANAMLQDCKDELRREGYAFNEEIQVGAMIEVPSAAMVAEHLAREVQFFSIGTNDLIQYSIAVDRGNDRVAHLYEPTHPAILRFLKMIVDAGHAADLWVGVCGEMAGEVLVTPLLLGLGIDELSTGAALVPRVKRAIQALDSAECSALVERLLQAGTSMEIGDECRGIARQLYPELLE